MTKPTEGLSGSEAVVAAWFRLGRWWPETLCVALYAIVIASAIPYHEPWADEAQAWQMARSAPSGELLRHFLRYEGSPGLWHLLLRALSRAGVSYAGMHWVTGAIAVIGAALLVFYSPFPRYLRLALPFTFFLAFQYAVVARSYALVPLLLFAVAACWRRSPVLVALLLGLLGNVAVHALAISGGLAVTYALERRRGGRNAEQRVGGRALLWAASLLALLYGVALWTVLPKPTDLSFLIPHAPGSLFYRLLDWPRRSAMPMLRGVMEPRKLAFAAWVLLLARLREVRGWIYLGPIATLALISGYYYSFWHAGLIVPTAVAVGWIAWRDDVAATWVGTAAKVAAMGCVALQIGWTVHALRYDREHPYSPDAAAANYLRPHVVAGEAMAVTYVCGDTLNAYDSVGLQPYFDRPIFLNQRRPFWLWSSREHGDAEFEAALRAGPKLVIAEFVGGSRFDARRDVVGPRVERLRQLKYRLTHVFCGEKSEGFREADESCHLIFER